MAEKQPRPRARKETPRDRIPRVIEHATLDDHFEVMTRAIFQAGLSWAFIDGRWPAFRAAFDDFAIDKVAAYGDWDVDRIMEADGVVHSRGKIAGTIANAQALRALVAEFGDVAAYAARFADYDALHRDAKQRFAYLGDLSCYYWLFRTRVPVPFFERWMERQERDHPRMREMVLLARETATSAER